MIIWWLDWNRGEVRFLLSWSLICCFFGSNLGFLTSIFVIMDDIYFCE